MKTIILPDELKLDSLQSVQVFDYRSSQEASKQQITLNQNAFSFLTEGTKEVVFSSCSLLIDNSQFLIMKFGNCLMTERLSAIGNYRSVLLFFNSDILLQFVRKIEMNDFGQAACNPVHNFVYDGFIRRFVNSLVDISELSKDLQNKLLEVKFEEIMIYLTARYGNEFLYSLTAKSDTHTQKFKQIIEGNQLNKLTLKELAFLCNMSISSFKREFEKHYTEPPIKWFLNKRLEHAHYLLNYKKKSSSEIYFELGFESLSSFIQAYKAHYRTTPKQHHKI